jgi:hypothetical protein
MPKVTMTLTDQDIENAEKIFASTNARSKADAVSIGLALCSFIFDTIRKGAQLEVRNRDGTVDRIVIPDLQGAGTPFNRNTPDRN